MHRECEDTGPAIRMGSCAISATTRTWERSSSSSNRDFNVRSDKQLGTFLKENGIASLNDLIESDLGKKK